MILLRHDQGYITTYAHNATLLVDVGDMVRRGQVIARVGDTGDAAQTMLYFELRKGRPPIDPQTRLVRDTPAIATSTQLRPRPAVQAVRGRGEANAAVSLSPPTSISCYSLAGLPWRSANEAWHGCICGDETLL